MVVGAGAGGGDSGMDASEWRHVTTFYLEITLYLASTLLM